MKWILLLCLTSLCYCWDEQDYSLFDLQDELRQLHPTADFYSILGIDRTAEATEVTKAYRKVALQHHPDKTTDKQSHKLYTILTSITQVLKDDEQRLRYDGHLVRGFPRWRGTGYYYRRYQPGLFAALVIILFFISLAQYIIHWIDYYRRKEQVQESIDRINAMTFAQVRKLIQKSSIEPLKKKELKNASPFQVLMDAGELDPLEYSNPVPSLLNLVIIQLPLSIATRLIKLVSHSDIPSKKSE